MDQGDRISMGGKGLGEVTSVGVQVFRMAAETPPQMAREQGIDRLVGMG